MVRDDQDQRASRRRVRSARRCSAAPIRPLPRQPARLATARAPHKHPLRRQDRMELPRRAGIASYPFWVSTTATESDYPFAADNSKPITVTFGRQTPARRRRRSASHLDTTAAGGPMLTNRGAQGTGGDDDRRDPRRARQPRRALASRQRSPGRHATPSPPRGAWRTRTRGAHVRRPATASAASTTAGSSAFGQAARDGWYRVPHHHLVPTAAIPATGNGMAAGNTASLARRLRSRRDRQAITCLLATLHTRARRRLRRRRCTRYLKRITSSSVTVRRILRAGGTAVLELRQTVSHAAWAIVLNHQSTGWQAVALLPS